MFSVLLVDDEELVRVSVRFSVCAAIPEVQVTGEAANGLEGLNQIREGHPDIVITDIRMPKLDGLQMIRAIREENLDVEIVVLSGYAEFEYARQAMKYGVTEYLLKPVEADSIRETLGACIARIAQRRGLIQEDKLSDRVISYIDSHYREDIFLDKLAEEFGFSSKYISAVVKSETGKNFSVYLTELRIKRAEDLLRHTTLGVKDIAASVGYADQRYFNRIFKKYTGKTPTEYRK